MASNNKADKPKKPPPLGIVLRSASTQNKQPLNSTTADNENEPSDPPDFRNQRNHSASSIESTSSTAHQTRAVRTSEDELSLPGGIDRAITDLQSAVDWFEFDLPSTESWKDVLDEEYRRINRSAANLLGNITLVTDSLDPPGGNQIEELQSRLEKAFDIHNTRKEKEVLNPPTINLRESRLSNIVNNNLDSTQLNQTVRANTVEGA